MRKILALLSLVVVGSALGIAAGAISGWLIAKYADYLSRQI